MGRDRDGEIIMAKTWKGTVISSLVAGVKIARFTLKLAEIERLKFYPERKGAKEKEKKKFFSNRQSA